jgi:PAS domain S-box-containing protein
LTVNVGARTYSQDEAGGPLVGGRWFVRLILFLAILTLVLAPLSIIFPVPDAPIRLAVSVGTGIGYFAAAWLAGRGRRPSALIVTVTTLLATSLMNAESYRPYEAEALGVAVIAAALVLPALSRRSIWPALAAIGLATIAAMAISIFGAPAAPTGGNRVGVFVGSGIVLAVSLAFVGWTHVRLATALERARRARAELDASEERYRTLVETAPEGILMIDPATGRAISANRRAAELFGYASVADLIDVDPHDVMPERQPDGRLSRHVAQADIDAALVGQQVTSEVVYRRADGSMFTAEVRAGLAVIAGRTEVRLSLTDITERVAAQRARILSEQRFRSLFASSPNAVLVVAPDGRIVDASDRVADVLGYAVEVLRGRSVEDLVPLGSRERHVAQRASFDAQPTARPMGHGRKVSALRGDGRVIPVEVGLSWFDTDEGRFTTVVVVDVSARQAAERAVREATETIRAIFDASPAGIVVTGLDGTVRLWNRAMTRLTDVADIDAVGRPDPSVPEDRLTAVAEIRAAVARNQTVAGAEVVLTRPDDSRIQAVGSYGPLHDAAGEVVGVVGVFEDVTAMRTLEAQVNRKARLESVGQLAGGIAHDINNVLTAIGGFATLTLDDLDAGLPVDREAIATIAEGAARTSALTRQLLAFARRDVRPAETLSLGEAVRAVEPMLRGLIGEHIALEIATADRGHVRIAGSQVEQLVLNLVVNARDALAGGGTIRVDVANIRIGDDQIGSHLDVAAGPYVALTVTDDGIGMPPDVAERVFDPFFTTKGPDEGTGLGLATVHGIVTGAGGHIWVYSEEGVGTTFRILLPRTDEVPDQAKTGPRVSSRGNETILLVEDEDLVRVLASRVLERAGFRLLTAADADEALAVAAAHDGAIDLLVTDVIMPRVLGPELAEQLARLRPGLRVLFTSGYTAGGAGVTATLPARARFIDKPFSPSDLVAAVRAAIDDVAVQPLA